MKNHVVIWGAGKYAKKIITNVEKYYCVDAVCDNNSLLWGQLFVGKYKIISVDDVIELYKNSLVLIALDNYETFFEVSLQLNKYQINYKHVNEGIYQACIDNNEFFYIDCESVTEIEKINTEYQNIYVLTAPSHSNLGDQAQSYCIEMFLKSKYPNSHIFIYDELSIVENFYELLYIIRQWLKAEDRIFLHSGYRLTNLYKMSEYIVEMMLLLFNKEKIVFLPQTINYTDDVIESRISKYINENITIMCRDYVSYDKALTLFKKSRVMLYPDVVTSLIGRYQFEYERDGILLILRESNDGESLLSNSDVTEMLEFLKSFGNVDITDTTIFEEWKNVEKNRKYYIEQEIKKYSKFKLIITNRYHGTIFSLIANTPVIVLPTKDHKITAGLNWFEEAHYEDIYFCERKDEIYDTVQKILHQNRNVVNSTYFWDKFYKDIDFEKMYER